MIKTCIKGLFWILKSDNITVYYCFQKMSKIRTSYLGASFCLWKTEKPQKKLLSSSEYLRFFLYKKCKKNRKNKGDEEMIDSRTKRLDVRTDLIRMIRIRFRRWIWIKLKVRSTMGGINRQHDAQRQVTFGRIGQRRLIKQEVLVRTWETNR